MQSAMKTGVETFNRMRDCLLCVNYKMESGAAAYLFERCDPQHGLAWSFILVLLTIEDEIAEGVGLRRDVLD